MKARKELLAKDAATVDARLKTLNAQLAKVTEERGQLETERERLEGDRRELDAEGARLEHDRAELEQSRRTFQAGLRSIEETRRHLAEREASLGAQAAQIEELRSRLEPERADLQRQQADLLALQTQRSDAALGVETLLGQIEAREKELRDREEELETHCQALAARSAELARGEEELAQGRRELEARTREAGAEGEVLEAQRREFESVVEAERSGLDEARRQAESRMALERAELERRAQELEEMTAAQRQAAEDDDMAVVQSTAEPAPGRVEGDLSARTEAIAQQEEALEVRRRSRLAELDRDIEQRLSRLEEEIKNRREQAERDLTERRRAHEEELREARGRLDEQVEELRRRQAAVTQEQAVLQQRRRELEAESSELSILRRRYESVGDLASSFEPAGESAADDWATVRSPAMPASESGGVFSVLPAGGSEPPTSKAEANVAASQTMQVAVAPDSVKERHRSPVAAPIGTERDGSPGGGVLEVRRRRPLWLDAAALALGIMAALVYLWWPSHEIEVRGRVALNATDSAAPLSEAEHRARLSSQPVLESASRLAGVDVQSLYRSGKIGLVVDKLGHSIELVTRAPSTQVAAAQSCIDAWGQAYQESLKQSVVSQSERQARLNQLEAERRKLQEERAAAAAVLEKLRVRLEADPRQGDQESVRGSKEGLKAKLMQARQEVDAAKAALAKLQATPPSAEPIVPTDQQLAEACAADSEVMGAITQRDAKAREFHRVLTEAMSRSQVPLANLLTSIEVLSSEVQQQLGAQSDRDIRRELEQVAVDVKDYREQAMAFSKSWDELAPKVGAWKAGGDTDLLLQYQKKAEGLIREFHSESSRSFGVAAQKADAIGRGGSEMTKRRIIQSRLLKASHACLEARNEWIVAARGAVPRYDLELKALQEAISDLTPRIEERRRYHREQLAGHLAKVRSDERAGELQSLRDQVEAATREHQRLSDEFVKMDAELTMDEGLRARLQNGQEELRRQEEKIARLDRQASEAEDEMGRLRGPEEVGLADAVNYRPLPVVEPPRFELQRAIRAACVGLAAVGVFALGFWVVAGERRPGRKVAP
jgi:DNA repair exonuclease SbcCD ATPase subunit